MKVGWQDIGQLDGNDPDDISRAIIVPAKEALRQTRQALTGNLTIRDNFYATSITLGAGTQSLTSGVEYVLQNPLKTTPIGFTVQKATDINGNALKVSSVKLNTTRTDGLLGITCDFYGSTGQIGETFSASLPRASAISLTTNVAQNVVSLTVSAGTWELRGGISFIGSPTGTGVAGNIGVTSASLGSSDLLGQSSFNLPTVPTAAFDVTQFVAVNPPLTVAASTAVFLVALATFTVGTIKAMGGLSATRLSVGPSAGIITGTLWGG